MRHAKLDMDLTTMSALNARILTADNVTLVESVAFAPGHSGFTQKLVLNALNTATYLLDLLPTLNSDMDSYSSSPSSFSK